MGEMYGTEAVLKLKLVNWCELGVEIFGSIENRISLKWGKVIALIYRIGFIKC